MIRPTKIYNRPPNSPSSPRTPRSPGRPFSSTMLLSIKLTRPGRRRATKRERMVRRANTRQTKRSRTEMRIMTMATTTWMRISRSHPSMLIKSMRTPSSTWSSSRSSHLSRRRSANISSNAKFIRSLQTIQKVQLKARKLCILNLYQLNLMLKIQTLKVNKKNLREMWLLVIFRTK